MAQFEAYLDQANPNLNSVFYSKKNKHHTYNVSYFIN